MITEAFRLLNREEEVSDDKNKKGGKGAPPKKDDIAFSMFMSKKDSDRNSIKSGTSLKKEATIEKGEE